MIGESLKHYAIESLLGAGGMGVVYRATDTRLGRSVAVKVLPEAFARDRDRVARFEREAKLLASLNNPNIAALYGMEEHEGRLFLIMELVEGETLAERLRRGPIPPSDSLKVALQIAEALEAAHHKGVVHRDLKPANVKITPEGKVKVLDFGLAKAMETAPASSSLSHSPTLRMAATHEGIILGTAGYMSPEQAKGVPADTRSDIFSFGCVLYEMLSGRQPFPGETASEVIASVLVRDPEWTHIPASLKPGIHELIRRCMEKSPRRRWQAAGDLRVEIESLLAEPLEVVVLPQASTLRRPIWKRLAPALIAAILASAITAAVIWNLRAPPAAMITRLPLTLPDDQSFSAGVSQIAALSRDGRNLAYSANNQLFIRSMDEMEARPLVAGTGLITAPFFSPDGQWVGFWSTPERELRKIPIAGGTPLTISKVGAAAVFGAVWEGDQIIFSDPTKGILRVPADGGEPEVLAGVTSPESAYGPQILDGGRALLFTIGKGSSLAEWDQAEVVVQPLPSGDRKVVVRGGSDARYVSSGHLVYTLGGNVLAVPFDLGSLETRGSPTPVLEGVMRASVPLSAATQFSVSDNGSLIYIAGSSSAASHLRTLALADRSGKLQRLPLPPAPYEHPRFSPDGKQLVVTTALSEGPYLSLYEISGGASLRRLTFEGRSAAPIWSHDGRYVIFTSDREGDSGLFRQLADGTGGTQRLTKAEPNTSHFAQSVDRLGRTLVFAALQGFTAGAIWTLPLNGDGEPKAFIEVPNSNEPHATFSPDGKWVAYMSTEINSRPEIFVQPYPATGTKYQITTQAGGTPTWSVDGKQIFYIFAPSRIIAVDIQTQPTFSVGKATVLPIAGSIHPIPGLRNYDVSPDGKQFVVVVPAADEKTTQPKPQIILVLNWLEDLKQRVPVR